MNKDDIDKHYDKGRLIILSVAAFLLVLIYAGDILYHNQKALKNEPKYKTVIRFNDGRSVTIYEKNTESAKEDWDSFDSGIKDMIRYSR